MALYRSELTQLMDKFFEQHPEEKTVQLQGHLIWWHKKFSETENMPFSEKTREATPYPYQNQDY